MNKNPKIDLSAKFERLAKEAEVPDGVLQYVTEEAGWRQHCFKTGTEAEESLIAYFRVLADELRPDNPYIRIIALWTKERLTK